MKIYTKKGDEGQTALFGGNRLYKSDDRIESYGLCDELNAHIGLLRDQIDHDSSKRELIEIQHYLFTIGSHLATENEKSKTHLPGLEQVKIDRLEQFIDQYDEVLEPLKAFILPGGHIVVSQTHICRTHCRNVERAVVKLHQKTAIDSLILAYLNRLSDYFFTLARFYAKHYNAIEVEWKP